MYSLMYVAQEGKMERGTKIYIFETFFHLLVMRNFGLPLIIHQQECYRSETGYCMYATIISMYLHSVLLLQYMNSLMEHLSIYGSV